MTRDNINRRSLWSKIKPTSTRNKPTIVLTGSRDEKKIRRPQGY